MSRSKKSTQEEAGSSPTGRAAKRPSESEGTSGTSPSARPKRQKSGAAKASKAASEAASEAAVSETAEHHSESSPNAAPTPSRRRHSAARSAQNTSPVGAQDAPQTSGEEPQNKTRSTKRKEAKLDADTSDQAAKEAVNEARQSRDAATETLSAGPSRAELMFESLVAQGASPAGPPKKPGRVNPETEAAIAEPAQSEPGQSEPGQSEPAQSARPSEPHLIHPAEVIMAPELRNFAAYEKLRHRPAEATSAGLRQVWRELELSREFVACAPEEGAELIRVLTSTSGSGLIDPRTRQRLALLEQQASRSLWVYLMRGGQVLRARYMDFTGLPLRAQKDEVKEALKGMRPGDQIIAWPWFKRLQSSQHQPWPELIGLKVANALGL